jgi:hypothetical protein
MESGQGGRVTKLLNPAYWGRALSNPMVLVGLAVDLLPIYAVFAWGWNAVPLVMLYWMENVIAGVMTIPRLVISGASYGAIGTLAGLGLSVFFVFHYGLFCLVHGTFLIAFASIGDPQGIGSAPFMDVLGMFRFGIDSGCHVVWMVYAIAAFQLLVFLVEFIFKGEWKRSNPMAEMFAPYSRIIVLHFGIFAGAAALFLLGQPMVGVLALILFRAVWGVMTNSKRFGMEAGLDAAVDRMGKREQFEKLLRGQSPE